MIDKEIFEIGGPVILESIATEELHIDSENSNSTPEMVTSPRSCNNSRTLPGNCRGIRLAKTDWLSKPLAKVTIGVSIIGAHINESSSRIR